MDTMSNLPPENSRAEPVCSTDREVVADDRRIAARQADNQRTGDRQTGSHTGERTDTSAEILASRTADGSKIRLAMSLIDGLSTTSADKTAQRKSIRTRLARAAGQPVPPESAATLRGRIKALARNADRGLAEQLDLLIRFDEQRRPLGT